MCVDDNAGAGQTTAQSNSQPNNLADQEVIIEADEDVFAHIDPDTPRVSNINA